MFITRECKRMLWFCPSRFFPFLTLQDKTGRRSARGKLRSSSGYGMGKPEDAEEADVKAESAF